MPALSPPTAETIRAAVRQALAEDIGGGDVSAALIPATQTANATILCRSEAVLCGTGWATETFRQVDPDINLDWRANDGDRLPANSAICALHGPARGILSAERTALNFLQTLSGVATLTRHYADAVADTGVTLLDTRKTLPGWRAAQKYAVRCGGGMNHRLGLYDAFLIKENHIRAAGGIEAAIKHARQTHPELPVIVEVETQEELQTALAAKPDRILLDNFDTAGLRTAVTLAAKRIPLEASGGITLDNIRDIAASGVNYISLGVITKDIRAVDLSLLFR